MNKNGPTGRNGDDALENHERLSGDSNGRYVLHLYIAGTTQKSNRAVVNIKGICESRLKDHYDLDVIDVYQQPELVKEQQIVAAPTLVKILPLPFRKFIGDMSNTERLLAGLGLT